GVKRDGSPKARASLKKLKTGGDDVNLVATSHGVPQEEAGATPSPNVSQEEVAAHSHSQDILDAPVKAPSTTASTAQHTGSSPKKVGTRRKRFGRKGVHPSRSTIPIEDGDPKAEHKMCIKYASDDDTPVNLHAVDKKATGTGLVLWGDLKVLIDSPEVNDDISGLVLHMFVDKKYPLSVNLIERMLDHQLEICRDIVGNELTTAVQLIVFLKKQIFDSRRAKIIVNVSFCLLENIDF
ncbi:hypothetical protein Tco_0041379, partial [Tanacetum coccineum]